MSTRPRTSRWSTRLGATATVAIVAATGGSVAWASPGVGGTTAGGTVSSWARYGSSAAPPAGLVATAVAADGTFSSPLFLALRPDRTVVSWPTDSYQPAGQVPDDLTDVRAIDVGDGVGVALLGNGSVRAWGQGMSNPQDVPPDLGPVAAISAGGHRGISGSYCGFVVVAKTDGTVRAWGQAPAGVGCYEDFTDQAVPPPGLRHVTSVAAGSTHALALRSDGTVVGWGYDHYGETTPPPGLAHVVQIAAGGDTSAALRDDGTVVTWGYGAAANAATVSGLRGVVGIALADRCGAALLADGSTRTWGLDPADAAAVPSGPGLTQLALGSAQGVAVSTRTSVGSPRTGTFVDSNPAGRAEAFRTVATSSARTSTLSAYVDEQSGAKQLQIGLYADASGKPGTLLTSGSVSRPVAGAWNTVTVPAATVTAGSTYWLALLAPSGSGVLRFRDLPGGQGGTNQTTAQKNLTALPTAWKTGETFANAPASMYAGG